MKTLYIIVGLVALQRLAELVWSNHNIRSLKAQGATETGSGHYPLFILVHGSWLLAILLLTPALTPVEPWALLLYCIMQVGRVWVLMSLGGYWTTRVITLPGRPLIRKGPYRFLRHPNYLIVACEIALLPLAFHDVGIAVTWSLANGVLLMWRIHVEDAALSARHGSASQVPSQPIERLHNDS
jgi:methyltransferase